MTQKEFEERTGMMLDAKEFGRVHDIYMACGDDVDKNDFCTLWKGEEFEELLNMVAYEKNITEEAYGMAMKKIQNLQEQQTTGKYEMAEFLVGKACAYEDTDFHREAVRLVGQAAVTFMKLRMDLPLWDEDKRFLLKHFEDGELRQVVEALERVKSEKETEAKRLE